MIEQAKDLLEKIYNNPRLGATLALGVGCERIAYKLTDDLVVKISKLAMYNRELLATFKEDDLVFKYSRGLWDYADEDQTEKEIDIYNKLSEEEKSIFNPILYSGSYKNHTFTIAPMVTVAKEYDCQTIKGLSNKLKKDFNFDILKRVCYRNELEYGDLIENSGNFGLDKDGNIVVIDFGLIEMKF